VREGFAPSFAIIAVFGGGDPETLALAEEFGANIAGEGHVLLTGGNGPGRGSVKACAISGALREGRLAPWVGVVRDKLKPPSCLPSGSGRVINTDLGHGRNYLEAVLCDGAIGLKGKEGTHSEIAFSISLSKPVVLVGDGWKTDPESGYPPGADNRIHVTSSLTYVKNTNSREYHGAENQRLDQLLKRIEEDDLGGLADPQPPSYVSLEVAEEVPTDVVAGVLSRLASNGSLRHDFPDLSGYEDVKGAYSAYMGSVSGKT
jgi:uncharacterized protein (TIGR00725 family)